MAYADLGGLGSKQGAPVFYDWAPPSLVPQVLPWLAILALLMLKPNRCASAWWILLPLACVAGVACLPDSALEFLPWFPSELYLETIGVLGFGVAAVWLLSSYLAWKHRMLAFLGMLIALGVFCLLALVLRLGGGGVGTEAMQLGLFLAVGGLVMSVALTLAGLACRGRYGVLRLSFRLIAALMVLWMLLIGPYFVITLYASAGNDLLTVLLQMMATATGITFGVMLPFLVLSFANGFYRERLKGLLHVSSVASPPILPPPVPAVPRWPQAERQSGPASATIAE